MRKLTIGLPIFLFFLGCYAPNPDVSTQFGHENYSIDNIDQISENILVIPALNKLILDSCSIGFYGGNLFHFCIDDSRVDFFFSPQCVYSYAAYFSHDTIFFDWSFDANCTSDYGVESNFQLKSTPKLDAPFGYITKESDTTLNIEYFYKEWVEKFNSNQMNQDVLFPNAVSVKQRNIN